MARTRSARRFALVSGVVFLLAGTFAAAEVRLATTLEDGAGGTRRIFYLDLSSGATFEASLRRSGRRLEVTRFEQNLFTEIGRGSTAARYGQFLLGPMHDGNGRRDRALLVETETGFAAVLDRLGKDRSLARMSVLPGRPASPAASDDGQFALLPSRDDNGETVGFYLHHGTTGRCVALLGLDGDETDSAPCSDLPILAEPLAVGLTSGEGQTRAWVLASGATGELYRVRPSSGNSLRLSTSEMLYDLDTIFGEAPAAEAEGEQAQDDGPAPRVERRYAMAPLSVSDRVEEILVFDTLSGRGALVRVGTSGSSVEATRLSVGLYDALLPADRARVLTLTARNTANGSTEAVWIFDSATNRILLLDSPSSADSARLQAVEILD